MKVSDREDKQFSLREIAGCKNIKQKTINNKNNKQQNKTTSKTTTSSSTTSTNNKKQQTNNNKEQTKDITFEGIKKLTS